MSKKLDTNSKNVKLKEKKNKTLTPKTIRERRNLLLISPFNYKS